MNQLITFEVGPRTAKLALLLMKFMIFGVVQFRLYEKEVQTVYINQTFMVNNQFA